MLIKDFDEFNRFLDILPELKNDEVYFVSMSARQKYLTPEERQYYGLGRTEMHSRVIVRSKDSFLHGIRKLSGLAEYRLTRNGLPIPEKASVVYVNINPSSVIKAYNLFVEESNRQVAQAITGLVSGSSPDLTSFRFLDKKFLNCVQKSTGTKHFIDIDIDDTDINLALDFSRDLGEYIEHYIIATKGGYHILIRRETLPPNSMLHELAKKYNLLARGEVVFNTNGMIPLPGTLHAGKMVEML
jgi:hypothetical protein